MIDAFSALEALPRWMAWREERRGSERARPTKVPYAAGEGNYGSSGGWGSATDPTTWGTHAQAGARARQLDDGRKVGCGTVLGDLGDKTYLGGADLDSSLDENGALARWAVRVITVLQTYAEVSPGGRGLKAFFRIPAELVRWLLDLIGVEKGAWGCKRGIPWLDGTDHGPGIEIYTSGRYFTVTGRIWSIDHPHIVTLDRDQVVALAALIPPLPGRSTPSGGTGNGAVGGRAEPGISPPRNSRDNSRSARAVRIAIALTPDTYDDMVDGLRNHAGDDIKAWVEDKGEARNERELKRIWDRIVARRASARAAGLAELGARIGAATSDKIEPDPSGAEPAPPRQSVELKDRVKDIVAARVAEGKLEPFKGPSPKDSRRFGAKGELIITISGPLRGSWHNRDSNQGGGVFSLITQIGGYGHSEAFPSPAEGWLRERLGIYAHPAGGYLDQPPRLATPENIAPEPTGPEPEWPRGNGHDPAAKKGSMDPKVAPGGGGGPELPSLPPPLGTEPPPPPPEPIPDPAPGRVPPQPTPSPPPVGPRPEIFSHEWLALQFSAEHHADWRYVALWGKWQRWAATRWRNEDTLRAFELARLVCRTASADCDNPKLAREIARASTVAGVERLARADRRHAMRFDQYDTADWDFNQPPRKE